MTPAEIVAKETIHVLNLIEQEMIVAGDNNEFYFESRGGGYEIGIPDVSRKTLITNSLIRRNIIRGKQINDYDFRLSGTIKAIHDEIIRQEFTGNKPKVIFNNIILENRSIALRVFKEIRVLENFSAIGEVFYTADWIRQASHYLIVQFVEKMATFELWGYFGCDEISGDIIIRGVDTKSLDELIELLSESEESKQPTNESVEKTEATTNVKNVSDSTNKKTWPNDFEWIGNNSFKFTFNSQEYSHNFDDKQDNNRLSIFKELTKSKGEWVKISILSDTTNGLDEANTRQTISQIEKVFKNKSIPIIIPASGNGEYRIEFIQTQPLSST